MWLNSSKLILMLVFLCSVAEANIIPPPLELQDEGTSQGRPVYTIDCVGAGVSCAHDGSVKATITVSGGGGGSEWTDGGNFLHPADLSGAETVVIGGTDTSAADIILGATGGATFNDQMADVNFNISSDNTYNMFHVDADKDQILIGGNDASTAAILMTSLGETTFGYSEVGDTEDGPHLRIYRVAPEGTSYWELEHNQFQDSELEFVGGSGKFTLRGPTNAQITLGGNAPGHRVKIGDEFGASGYNPDLELYGYITADADSLFVEWNIDDSTDKLELVRESNFITAYNIDIPTEWGSAAGVMLGTDGTATFNTSAEIPNGTGPTVDVAGEIAVDTTDDQLIYYGAAKRVIPYEKEFCILLDNLQAGDDNTMIYSPQDNITLVKANCHCDETNGDCTTEADIILEHREVGTATVNAVTGTITCEDQTTGDTYTTLSGDTTMDAGDMLRLDVDNVPSPTTDDYTLCVVYTVDAQ